VLKKQLFINMSIVATLALLNTIKYNVLRLSKAKYFLIFELPNTKVL
jgi:hypothetical protein